MSRRRSLLAGFLACALLSVAAADAARLPDWARAIADSARPTNVGVAEHAERVLFREQRIEVFADGERRIRLRKALQVSIARPGVALGVFPFRDNTRILSSRAWHLPPGEHAEKAQARAWIDISINAAFFSDSRARVVQVDGLRPGSLVFFEFEAEERPYELSLSEVFYDDSPTDLARLEVVVPPGWSSRARWLRAPTTPTAAVSGASSVWEVRDLPAPDDAPLGESAVERAPHLLVDLIPPATATPSAPRFTDWTAVGRWFEGLAQGRDQLTPEIRAAAEAALRGTETDAFGRISRLARFVRDDVRYLGDEVGLGGYQPRPAAATLANRYGDCKDKATLLRALLSTQGVSSHLTLLNLTDRAAVSADFPSLSVFDHAIVAVRLPPGAAVPDGFAAAVLDSGELGRLLFVDPTDEDGAPGWVSGALAGKKALVLADSATRLVDLPAAGPEAHRIERQLSVEIRDDGSLSCRRISHFFGDPARAARRAYREDKGGYRLELLRRLRRSWIDVAMQTSTFVVESPEGSFVEELSWQVAGGAAAPVPFFPGAADDLPRAALGQRRLPIVFATPFEMRVETTVSHAPADAPLPEARGAREGGWVVATAFDRTGGAVRGRWAATLSQARFEPADFAGLKRFWAAASATAAAVLQSPPTSAP